MPYKLSRSAMNDIKAATKGHKTVWPWDLTDLQAKALDYAWDHEGEWFGAANVATEYGYPNGQYFRGVLASLHKRGLLYKGVE